MPQSQQAGPSRGRLRSDLELGSSEWLSEFRNRVLDELRCFLFDRKEEINEATACAGGLVELATEFLSPGKCLRSAFAYLGWLSARNEAGEAVRAASSLELLHAFALIQDDVMDGSVQRRGRPAVHQVLATEHGLDASGGTSRFGESAAILLSDLCLVWSEQALRDSGLPRESLDRAWSCYNQMRQELAIGQYLDLRHTAGHEFDLTQTLEIARLKSARYTVTRPLLLGTRLAGGPEAVEQALVDFGDAIGEAFQIRDDVLGVFGDPNVSGKPANDDLQGAKATTLVALAGELGRPAQQRELHNLLQQRPLDRAGRDRLRALITDTGALKKAETMIDQRLTQGMHALAQPAVPHELRSGLRHMAEACVDRVR